MALATYGAEVRPRAARALKVWLDAASRHVRLTAAAAVLVMFGCFAAATALEMRRDYAHALSMAQAFTVSESRTVAAQAGQALDGIVGLGRAYAEANGDATVGRAIDTASEGRVLNLALADTSGRFVAALKGRPQAAKPLSGDILARARVGATILAYSDPAIGSSPLTLIFSVGEKVAVVPLDPVSLLPRTTLAQAALLGTDGVPLALDKTWQDLPPPAAMRGAGGENTSLLNPGKAGAARLIALTPVPGWPLDAAASISAGAALDTWYGSLPLYLFVIVGPAVAGAILAALLVREFERADRARSALISVRALEERKAKQPHVVEAELLARLAVSERRAAEAHRAKTEFIANMSHELRTPLNAIIGFSEIIQRGIFGPPGHEKYGEYARDIAEAGRGLHQRIGEILEFAAIEAGRQKLNLGRVDVASLAKSSVEQMQGETLGRRIVLDFQGTSPPARADEAAVKRILAVTLLNAVRHTRDGGALRVEVRQDEETVLIVIRENGAGIFPGSHGQPDRAYVAVSATSDTGLALGLSMAVGLARRMGGALRLTGAAGKGTWAELRLPAA